jgi:hypothetical protein
MGVRSGRQGRRRGAWAAALLAGLLLGWPAVARAYIPSLQEIYDRIAASRPALTRAVIETRSVVYDPQGRYAPAEGGALHPDAVPPEVPGRGFRQKIYWIRNTFLGVETYAEDGKLLHFYLHEGFLPIQGGFDPARPFSEEDVIPPYLPFLAADPAEWREAIAFWGLNPQRVELARGYKGDLYFRLVEGEGRALWIDAGLLRPVRLETRLIGGAGERSLTLAFGEFFFLEDESGRGATFYYPRTINYLLDGRLFRQTVVLSFEADPSVQGFPISRLRQMAGKVQPLEPLSLDGSP